MVSAQNGTAFTASAVTRSQGSTLEGQRRTHPALFWMIPLPAIVSDEVGQ